MLAIRHLSSCRSSSRYTVSKNNRRLEIISTAFLAEGPLLCSVSQ
jgi:hypothetical protein